jgi:hypothetical protein
LSIEIKDEIEIECD